MNQINENFKQPERSSMVYFHSAREVIRQLFENAIQQRVENPKNCFIVKTAVELHKNESVARDLVNLNWVSTKQLIHNLIEEVQLTGEFSKALNLDEFSNYLINALMGLRLMGISISDREKLQNIIEINMSVFDEWFENQDKMANQNLKI